VLSSDDCVERSASDEASSVMGDDAGLDRRQAGAGKDVVQLGGRALSYSTPERLAMSRGSGHGMMEAA
jgi:hypothetical protein